MEVSQDNINQIQQFQQNRKMRAKVIQDAAKTYCGMDKAQIFKKIILPVLKTLADGSKINIIDVIHQIVNQISDIDNSESAQKQLASNNIVLSNPLTNQQNQKQLQPIVELPNENSTMNQ